MGVNHIN